MRRTETYRISGSHREGWVGGRKWFVPPFVLVLLLLGESLALAAASGSVYAKAVTDSLGKISTGTGTAILHSDDTLAWDYTFAQGSWAKLDWYVDGKKRESLLDFVVWYGPSPYDTRIKLFSIDWNPASLQPGSAWARENAFSTMLGVYRAPFRREPIAEHGRPTLPALYVFGGRDAFMPRAASELTAELIGRDRVVELPEASHWIPLEDPERTGELLVEFFGAGGAGR